MEDHLTKKKPISQSKVWVIDRLENGMAVLVESGQELIIPRGQLPEKIKDGDVVTAEFYLAKDEKDRRENLARLLLEEILGKR